jgi:septal ring factor EnvC (AmiA/AmiB activator)
MRSVMLRAFPALLACLLLGTVLAQTDPVGDSALLGKIEKSSNELARIRLEIKQQQEQMADLDARQNQYKRDHQDIVTEIDLIQQLLNELDQRERLLQEQSTQLEYSLQRSVKTHRRGQQALARNLRSMYMRGRYRRLEMILTADSFSSFVTRMKWEAMLTRLGAGLVERTRGEGLRIHQEKKELEVARAEINLAREEAGLQTGRLEDLIAEKMAALRDLEAERKGIHERILELSMNEQRLNYVLEDLEQVRMRRAAASPEVAPTQGSPGVALPDLAGALEWPVRGKVLRSFGRSVHPRFKTVTVNNGINIAAGLGAPVAAVGKGQVEFADVLPGFGQCVILDHTAGYYTLYAHLDQVFVAKGEQIARGQVIAEVGKPAAGEPAQLYFEVRHGKTPLDPLDWLRPR